MSKALIALSTVAVLSGCASFAPQQTFQAPFFVDPRDRAKANEVLEGGSEDFPVTWASANGLTFTVAPTRTYKIRDQDCRDYMATDGHRKIKGSACRRDDGTWAPL